MSFPLLPDSERPSLVREETVWNVAYGSNMDVRKLKSRTPTGRRTITPLQAIPVTVPGYALAFLLPGLPPNEPVMANAERVQSPTPSRPLLHAVAYELTRYDYDSLCMSEHCAPAHFEPSYIEVPVSAVPYDKDRPPVAATIFEHARGDTCCVAKLPVERRSVLRPSRRYLTLLREGAAFAKVDDGYVTWLNELREARPVLSPVGKFVCNMALIALFTMFNSRAIRPLFSTFVKRFVLPPVVMMFVWREEAAARGNALVESLWNLAIVLIQIPASLAGVFCATFVKARVLFKE